ncbi:MAG: YceI family protein [Ignavibacteria bacterium]|nr:YceI family protein [Ignavibacteria bacterium]MCU7503529.1 YceI family protein [Ignavibacteria bacterium]MCU7517275.1 YceI family protein [Ignavibacteria bacterium]
METVQKESIVGNWAIDKSHTRIQFSARHMVISEVQGVFREYDLKMKVNGENFTDSSIEFKINPASIDTGVADRDAHLRSEDFFGAENFKEIRFVSRSIEKADEEKYRMRGDLTIRDVTKTIDLDVTYGGQIMDPYGNLRAGFNVTGTINRFDYGLKWNALIETGGAVVGKNIKINCDVEIVKQK